MTLVVDASVAVPACLVDDGFALLAGDELVAPPLLWSESLSVLHELVWRGEIAPDDGVAACRALEQSPLRRIDDERLLSQAWHVAEEFGWAKTYDAEYIGLAQLLGCRLVTLDARLKRGAERTGLVILVGELG